MRLARARTETGIVEGDIENGRLVTEDGEYALGDDASESGGRNEATLLAPCEPSALYCVGRNYAATIEQMDYDRPDEPDFFIKPPT